MTISRFKLAVGALAVVAALGAMQPAPAEARNGRNGALAAGVAIGALGLAAAAGAAHAAPGYYYAPAPTYVAPTYAAPTYYYEEPVTYYEPAPTYYAEEPVYYTAPRPVYRQARQQCVREVYPSGPSGPVRYVRTNCR